MKDRKVTKGPSIDQIMEAIKKQKTLTFTVDYGWGLGDDEMIPHGIEKVVDRKGDYYNISATVVAANTPPRRQHFIHRPRDGNWGFWVGAFKPDYKAYEGHST